MKIIFNKRTEFTYFHFVYYNNDYFCVDISDDSNYCWVFDVNGEDLKFIETNVNHNDFEQTINDIFSMIDNNKFKLGQVGRRLEDIRNDYKTEMELIIRNSKIDNFLLDV